MNKSLNILLREGLSNVNEIVKGDYTVYHGSPNKIAKFTDDFVGRKEATDLNGPGIYFTTSENEARGYAGTGGYVYKVKLHVDKLLESTKVSESSATLPCWSNRRNLRSSNVTSRVLVIRLSEGI